MNLFYPPIVTYVPLLIKLFTEHYYTALKIFASITICLSGITMYHFIYQITKKRTIALFSAIFYLIAPYKLANVYKRFAIGEFTAMIFIPLVFLGLYNLFNQDGKKHHFITIGATGLMLTHTVTTLYTMIFSIVYILFNYKKLKNIDIIKKCIINVIFILLISMLFWAPLLEAKSKAEYTILNDEIMRTYGDFAQNNTILFSQLFKDIGEEDGTTFKLGLPTIITILITLFVAKKVEKEYKEIYLLNIIFSIFSIFMCSRFFPWSIMPNIFCKLQYPWRMLGFFNFFISFVCGVNLYIILKGFIKLDILKIVILFIFVILSITDSLIIQSQFFEKNKDLDYKYEKYILENRKISHMNINRDYMPVKAIKLQNSYVSEREDKTYILSGSVEFKEEIKDNLHDTVKIKNGTKDSLIEFPYFYYPGYEIIITHGDNKTSINSFESEHGYVSCVLPEDIDDGEIEITYVGTFITYFSYTISFLSLILFCIYVVYENKKYKTKNQNI